MKEKEFHADHWQGKRKDQVEKSYKGFGISIIGLIIFVVVYVIFEIIKTL
jgi:hypothetical protein